jgi:hypothetical protein
MRTLTVRPAAVILLMTSIAFGASCASGCPPRFFQEDDRPPVVVSSGSVGFDPTAGSFERIGNSRNWRHKGIRGRNARPVRFDVSAVTGTSCPTTQTFDATEMILAVSSTTSTERGEVKFHIQGNELRLMASRDMRMQGNHIRWDNWAMESLRVTAGVDTGKRCDRTGGGAPMSFTVQQRQ